MKSYSKTCSLLIIYPSILSPHIREYNTGLDSGFYAVDSGFVGPYYGFQIPGFRSRLQTFTGFSVPQEKTSRIRNPESLIFYKGRLLIALISFFCYYFHLFAHLIQSMFVLCNITRYTYYLFRGCHMYCFNGGGALLAADPHSYRKWKPIHARKFGYDVGVRPLSVHTDSEGRGKKTR